MHLQLSTPILVGLGVLAVIQLTLLVVALVTLLRTPQQRLALPKFAWALIILLVNIAGPIVFLAVGRGPAPVVEARPRHAVDDRSDVVERALDELYGARR